MAQAALEGGISPRQLSFKHTVQLWGAWRARGPLGEEDEVQALLVLIGQQRVGKRPGRVELRAVKRRPKCYKRLWAPRAVARRQIRRP